MGHKPRRKNGSRVLLVLLLVLAKLFFSFESTSPGGGEPTRIGEVVLAQASENNAEIEQAVSALNRIV